MDLLGSILNSMDKNKPPVAAEHQRTAKKKLEDLAKKHQEEERAQLKKFKDKMELIINKFVTDDYCPKLALDPMAKVQRAIVHEIAEIAGLSAFSFGEEDVDRHVVLFKRESTPCNEELNAYRKGLTWNPDTKAEGDNVEVTEEESGIIEGKEVAKAGAKVTEINKQYGLVPRENKKDHRSIEQTLNDIRAKKKLKVDHK